MSSTVRNLFSPIRVILKWSEVLESAFDYYYRDFIPVWALNDTPFCIAGDKLSMSKKTKEWVSWERIDHSKRPGVVTLFDLLPDLPNDEEYWKILNELRKNGVKDAENYFWENIFSYNKVKEVEVKGRKYEIQWEA